MGQFNLHAQIFSIAYQIFKKRKQCAFFQLNKKKIPLRYILINISHSFISLLTPIVHMHRLRVKLTRDLFFLHLDGEHWLTV